MAKVNPMQILIVDDNGFVREALAALVNCQADMQVIAEAQNGQEGVDLYRQHQPDLTLMDLRMPVMNGAQAIAVICGEFPRACILLLTASENPGDIQEALRAGARQCLYKDIHTEDLVRTIREVFAEKRSLAQS